MDPDRLRVHLSGDMFDSDILAWEAVRLQCSKSAILIELPREVVDIAGDCDDYAVLADYVLSRRGLGTKLVHVRLVGRVAHAVCYVNEEKAYLDYNNRKYFVNLQKSGATLREIAEKVSKAIEGNWTSASEFTYDYATNEKAVVRTVAKTSPPALDADVVAANGKAGR